MGAGYLPQLVKSLNKTHFHTPIWERIFIKRSNKQKQECQEQQPQHPQPTLL